PQTEEGNRWFFRQANSTDFVRGVVAWMDLQDPTRADSAIDELKKEAKFIGIRHIVQDERDPKWILGEPVVESFKELARRHVSYDMVIKPKQLQNVPKLLDKVPDLPLVIDHIAKPNIAAGGSLGWKENLAAVAQSPHVYCKLSGMVTEADWHKRKSSDLKPYV